MKISIIFSSFRFFSLFSFKDRCGRWSKSRLASSFHCGGAESMYTVETLFLFFGTEKPLRSDDFCLYLHIQPRFRPPPRPQRANPAPTKGSVTFLNEEINLSWHPSPARFRSRLYGNLFQKRWRNNLWFHPTRFLCLNLIYKSLILSFRILFQFFLHTAAVAAVVAPVIVQKTIFPVPNKTKIGFYAKLPSRNIFYVY